MISLHATFHSGYRTRTCHALSVVILLANSAAVSFDGTMRASTSLASAEPRLMTSKTGCTQFVLHSSHSRTMQMVVEMAMERDLRERATRSRLKRYKPRIDIDVYKINSISTGAFRRNEY